MQSSISVSIVYSYLCMISVVTSTAAAITTHGNHDSNNDNKHTEGSEGKKNQITRT